MGKLYGISPDDPDYFDPPKRHRAEITMRRGDKVRDLHFSKTNNDELIKFCQGTGLRRSELEALRELNPEGQRDIGIVTISTLDVDQFYGIEFEEFPARIAEVAMWMMDHIMNNRLSLEFGQTFIRIPLQKSPHIQGKRVLGIPESEHPHRTPRERRRDP